MTTSNRKRGFILFTDLPKAGPYLQAIEDRGLVSLVMTGPPQWPMEHLAASFVGAPGHAFEGIEALRFVVPTDLSTIVTQIGSWAEEYDVVGVFTSSEVFVEPAAQVADLLELRGVGLRAAKVSRNKMLQRAYLRSWSPRSVPAGPNSQGAVRSVLAGRFPLITKPLDLYCSIGVQVLDDEEGLADHLATLDASDTVLIEECLSGREFSVESIVLDGRPLFSSVTQKETSEASGEFFVEMAHTVPATNVTEAESVALVEAQAGVIEGLSFGTGVAHGEFRLTDDGAVVLMEIAARPPGDGILALYHLATGVSMESAAIGVALGEPDRYPQPTRWARQVYFEHGTGTLADVVVTSLPGAAPLWLADHGLWPVPDPAEASSGPGVRQLLVLKARGAELAPIVDSFGRAVTALFDAPSVDDLIAFEARLRDSVRIVND